MTWHYSAHTLKSCSSRRKQCPSPSGDKIHDSDPGNSRKLLSSTASSFQEMMALCRPPPVLGKKAILPAVCNNSALFLNVSQAHPDFWREPRFSQKVYSELPVQWNKSCAYVSVLKVLHAVKPSCGSFSQAPHVFIFGAPASLWWHNSQVRSIALISIDK